MIYDAKLRHNQLIGKKTMSLSMSLSDVLVQTTYIEFVNRYFQGISKGKKVLNG